MPIQPSPFFIIEREQLQSGDFVYVASDPALPGCVAHGGTADAAALEFAEARAEYLDGLGDEAAPPAPIPVNPAPFVIDLNGSVNTRLMSETYSQRS